MFYSTSETINVSIPFGMIGGGGVAVNMCTQICEKHARLYKLKVPFCYNVNALFYHICYEKVTFCWEFKKAKITKYLFVDKFNHTYEYLKCPVLWKNKEIPDSMVQNAHRVHFVGTLCGDFAVCSRKLKSYVHVPLPFEDCAPPPSIPCRSRYWTLHTISTCQQFSFGNISKK